jgi:hypothetical protein
VKELDNQIKQRSFNNLTKGAIAMIIIASAVVFSATNVFADETTGEAPIIDLRADSNSDSQKEIKPSLLPGDFLYFSKILIEKIRLALTIDDVKEARLMAEYASERLTEAEALFAEGNEETAVETMKKAIESIEIADTQLTTLEEEASGELVQAELNQAEDAVSQNIIALTVAMEKVKNPVAKAALKKNIKKSHAKLAKKIQKREEKQQKTMENSTKEAAVINPNMETTTPEVTLPVTPQPSLKAPQQTALEEKKSAKQELHQQMKESKVVEKEKKTEIKQAIKELKQDSKGNNGKGN